MTWLERYEQLEAMAREAEGSGSTRLEAPLREAMDEVWLRCLTQDERDQLSERDEPQLEGDPDTTESLGLTDRAATPFGDK